MRRALILLCAPLALSLACINGGQPATYKIALDQSPLETLPGSCYTSGMAPTNPPEVTGLFADREWTFWEGSDGKIYLDMGTLNVGPLGSAGNISFTGMVQGGPREWIVERKATFNTTELETRSFTFTFTDLGFTAEGSLLVKYLYECTGCGRPSCEATLPFNGRKIEAQATTIYGG